MEDDRNEADRILARTGLTVPLAPAAKRRAKPDSAT